MSSLIFHEYRIKPIRLNPMFIRSFYPYYLCDEFYRILKLNEKKGQFFSFHTQNILLTEYYFGNAKNHIQLIMRWHSISSLSTAFIFYCILFAINAFHGHNYDSYFMKSKMDHIIRLAKLEHFSWTLVNYAKVDKTESRTGILLCSRCYCKVLNKYVAVFFVRLHIAHLEFYYITIYLLWFSFSSNL